ncbi:MAG: energy coupling factor transporter S component ThiW [Phascolarctobacterium sp.]|nr:energy coupling factor transporter S component ThiW [Phascolarctobacterium sp.]
MQTRKLTIAALFIAIGTLTAHLIYIPAGISRCFPVQHAINVMAAVLLGADYATAIGFVIACLRNMFGTGSLLAFPGSMIGAFLAGILYQRHNTLSMAVVGEIFGTGILGGFLAWVIAYFILGSSAVAWFFIPPFLISSIGGSFIALMLLKTNILKQIN